jgi:integrase
MARKAKELSALEVSRDCTSPGLHFVGGVAGLALQVLPAPSTARTWVLRVMVAGKRREMGLGGYPDVTLAGAREAARIARAKIDNGIDPIEDRRAKRSELQAQRASAMTFSEAATAYIAMRESEWSNTKHADQWRTTLETYAEKYIGSIMVRDIDHSHVLKVLQPIWLEKTETAKRLRGRIESILDWARVRGYRSGENPARWRGHLDMLLQSPGKVQKKSHFPALPFAEIAAFLVDLQKAEGTGARALELAILTAARSGEVRGATWDEFDIDQGVWTIPGARMKAKKEHRVALNDEAVVLLKSIPEEARTGLVFPSAKGTPLSDMTLTATLRRMGKSEITAHGFRSTFRDWASERTSYPNEVVEMALAHTIKNKVEAAYRRGDLFEKRQRLMKEWGKFCSTLPSTSAVTPINANRAIAT